MTEVVKCLRTMGTIQIKTITNKVQMYKMLAKCMLQAHRKQPKRR